MTYKSTLDKFNKIFILISEKLELLKIELILTFFAVFYWISFIINKSSNMPIMDDYDSILKFLNKLINESFIGSIAMFFSVHNEHPLLFSNIFVAVSFWLFGEINFTYLIIFSNTILIGFFYLINITSSEILKKPVTLINSLLIFNLCAGTVAIWPMAGLQHFSSTALAFLTIYLFSKYNFEKNLAKNTIKYLILFISSLSGGANIFLLPIVFFITIQGGEINKIIKNIVFSLITAFVYIYIRRHSNSNASIIDSIQAVKFFFLFLGGAFGEIWAAYIAGTSTLTLIFIGFFLGFGKKYSLFFHNSLYILLVGIAASISRSSFGPEYAMETKYSIYSISIIISTIVMYLSWIEINFENYRNIMMVFLIFISATLFFNSYITNGPSINNLAKINWIIHPDHSDANSILINSKRLGIYDGQKHITNYPK